MTSAPSPLAVVLKGLLAGGLATGVSYTLGRLLFGPFAPPEFLARRGPPPPHRIVTKFARGIFEVELTERQHAGWVWFTHFAYGGTWGLVYALFQSTFHLPALLHGLAYGAAVWTVGHFLLLPATKIAPPASRQPRSIAGRWLLVNLVWGVTQALLYARLVPARAGRPNE
ncbi:MAG TPA: DUF1440 domain-containing protein [Chloroflexota bacterium]|jgi:uncharacterized membrane protein YagU involved in acid resistance|nr:DUF1440 domain-containing protein [Chloroflexota bacterium]